MESCFENNFYKTLQAQETIENDLIALNLLYDTTAKQLQRTILPLSARALFGR